MGSSSVFGSIESNYSTGVLIFRMSSIPGLLILPQFCAYIQTYYITIHNQNLYLQIFVMNFLSNMDEIANVVIRPSRYFYKLADLGPKTIIINQRTVTRNDFEVKNQRGHNIKGSVYSYCGLSEIKNIIIYLHCNSGCRIQGLAYLKLAIENDFTYVVFDFSGSGNSQGKYVSLGYYEVDDLTSVIEHIKTLVGPEPLIALWGRSMGAVTALRYLQTKTTKIVVGIFDSPFQSLKELFLQIGSEKTKFPKIVLQMAYKYLKPIIQQKANFNIDCVDLQLNKHSNNCPGIFIASKNDSLIPFQQIDSIFKNYQGQKEMFFIQESHNQSRNIDVIGKVFKAVQKYFHSYNTTENNKSNYYSFLPRKNQEVSRQKLQLTIKSYSQKALLIKQQITPFKKHTNESSQPLLEKRQISALFGRKGSVKLSEPKEKIQLEGDINRPSIQTRRKPISIRKFFKQQPINENQIKFKPNIQWEKDFIITDDPRPKEKTRKTIENMAYRRPPFSQLKHSNDFRVSYDSQTKRQNPNI